MAPALIFETGTFDGLGSAVLGRALQRNGRGQLLTFDVKAGAGWLVPDGLPVEVVIGDSLETLPQTISRVGHPQIMLHDSWHSYNHELAEYQRVFQSGMLLITDNDHGAATKMSALADFSNQNGLTYRYWREKPLNHWYGGGGIGVARS